MNATLRPSRFRLERPGRFFLLALAGALLLALAAHGIRWAAAAQSPFRGACWIWAPGVEPTGQPAAFYAVGDFELATVEPVQIAIAADEAYELHVNGRPVGVGVYRPGQAIDRYRLDGLLRLGSNRLTVRLQSQRGLGGFLATVSAVEPERTLTVTTGAWRIFRQHDPQLFEPGTALTGGELPQVWQRAPTGRWRLHPATGDLPLLPPASVRPPRRVRDFYPEARWFDLRRPRKSPIRFLQALLDWGEEVTGLLSFELASPASQPALAYFGKAATGAEIPDPTARPADATLLFVPGQTSWRDVRPRRFRYVLLVGVEPIDRVWVQELASPAAGPPSDPAGGEDSPAGVWGIRPPPRTRELQDSVWQRVRTAAEERAKRSQM